MGTLWNYIKKGNISSGYAALGNVGLAIIKGVVAVITGSGAIFAETMHSLADAVNQAFVFVGSILSQKNPTKKFPTGFGRLINIFCMVAVIVVTLMAYETILEGFHLIKHPIGLTNLTLSLSVLIISIVIDGYILSKALKEIVKETHAEAKGIKIASTAFRNIGRAAPPTRLVFYEDIVATLGALLAIIAVIISYFTPLQEADGIAAIVIGIMLLGAAFKVGYDNMVGLIGVAAPKEIEDRVTKMIFASPHVTDINKIRIVQEGRFYHTESYVELQKGLTLAEAAEIKIQIRDRLLQDPDISDVTLGVIEDNDILNWSKESNVNLESEHLLH